MIHWNKKSKTEQEKNFKLKVIKNVLIIVGSWILIIAFWAYLVKKTWTPEVYTKEVFTEEEQKTIIEILGEKFDNIDNVQIDFIRYSCAREAWCIVYISNANRGMINEDYKLNWSDYPINIWDGEEVSAEWYNVDPYTECYIYETDAETKAMLKFRGHYKELYEIVKDK